MPKKPSEWTPQEAHERLRTIVVDHLNQAGFYPTANSIRTSTKFDFPSDPPERVSDSDLQWMASPDVEKWFAGRMVELMALELIERRKADEEQGR